MMYLVVPAFLVITLFAREEDITRDMKSCAESVHAIWMFHRNAVTLQGILTIAAIAAKFCSNCIGIARVRN